MDKKLTMALVLACVLSVALAGCETGSWFKKESKPTPVPTASKATAQQAVVTAQEQYYLDTWLHAAQLAEGAQDYAMAIQYYTKVKEYFPDLKEGQEAEKKLKELERR